MKMENSTYAAVGVVCEVPLYHESNLPIHQLLFLLHSFTLCSNLILGVESRVIAFAANKSDFAVDLGRLLQLRSSETQTIYLITGQPSQDNQSN